MTVYDMSARIETLTIPTFGTFRKMVPIAAQLFQQFKSSKELTVNKCQELITQTSIKHSLDKTQETALRDMLTEFTKSKMPNLPLDGDLFSFDKITKFLDIHLRQSLQSAMKELKQSDNELTQLSDNINSADDYTSELYNKSRLLLRIKQAELFKTMRACGMTLPTSLLSSYTVDNPTMDSIEYYIEELRYYNKNISKGFIEYLPFLFDAFKTLRAKLSKNVARKITVGSVEIDIEIPRVDLASILDDKTITQVTDVVLNKNLDTVDSILGEVSVFIDSTERLRNEFDTNQMSKFNHLKALWQQLNIAMIIEKSTKA